MQKITMCLERTLRSAISPYAHLGCQNCSSWTEVLFANGLSFTVAISTGLVLNLIAYQTHSFTSCQFPIWLLHTHFLTGVNDATARLIFCNMKWVATSQAVPLHIILMIIIITTTTIWKHHSPCPQCTWKSSQQFWYFPHLALQWQTSWGLYFSLHRPLQESDAVYKAERNGG